MKRFFLLPAAMLLIFALCACGSQGAAGDSVAAETTLPPTTAAPTEPSVQDILTAQSWMNIYDGDVYILNPDGTGTHNGISLVYTLEESTLSVTEGVASLISKAFRLDQSGPYLRLIPLEGESFYVTENDYPALADRLRRESIQILLSYDLWKCSSTDGYLAFYENGTGALKFPSRNIDQETTWEMSGNNTLCCTLPVDTEKKGVLTLKIVNENGRYTMLTDDPDVYYTPFGDPRPQTVPSSSLVFIEAGVGYTVGLKADGTAVSVGVSKHGQRDIGSWSNLAAISGCNMHTVGLLPDGSLIVAGNNDKGQCNVTGWTDIASVDTSYFHTAALKTDGTAVAVGYNENGQCDVGQWTDLTAISTGGYHTLGLKADGTVVAVGTNGNGRCDVGSWTKIVAVSGGGFHSVGLRFDGTVVAVGSNNYGQCDVSSWQNIVAISAGDYHTVGLKADGTVVATGLNNYNQCHVSTWQDIVAISAGGLHTVGMKANGALIAIGQNDFGQCDVDTLMKNAG